MMSFKDGQKKFDECPVCSSCHVYGLEIIRKPLMVIPSAETMDEDVRSRFDAVFTCPEKGEEFEAPIIVVHRMYERVDQVHTRPEEDQPEEDKE